ncbi:hypothetical protein QF042_005074 [Pedobacter sp. W3I1]|uniref:hypothetical protein n=1 Tax=Pedobacter sp. W3I1 TaxID=3042291 RepID=UPI00278129CA|nr:hypothetical protein [Pedobacter sp. W3I1]MDQ0641509.1 hypothetical protein [Pedobacter sp. W3I1]
MADFTIDYLQVKLEEKIPLSEQDIKHIGEQKRDFFKDTPGILLACTLLIMAVAYYFLHGEWTNLRYYHYIVFVLAGLALFSLLYLTIWLVFRNFRNNWERDIKNGKNKLSSVIISYHKTEHGEYIVTFAGRHKGEKIRMPVKKTDYYNYQIGTKVLVTYLKYSKEVLELTAI